MLSCIFTKNRLDVSEHQQGRYAIWSRMWVTHFSQSSKTIDLQPNARQDWTKREGAYVGMYLKHA